ncbi:MAG: hypothetical protein JXR29_07720 [Methylothermaceae bacterium]|nr:hypothetical protein [Methylothermaceae bacterium]
MAAFSWAVAALLFRQVGSLISSVQINLCKGLLALVLLLLTAWWLEIRFSGLTLQLGLILLSSGIVGIGVGNTAFFSPP